MQLVFFCLHTYLFFPLRFNLVQKLEKQLHLMRYSIAICIYTILISQFQTQNHQSSGIIEAQNLILNAVTTQSRVARPNPKREGSGECTIHAFVKSSLMRLIIFVYTNETYIIPFLFRVGSGYARLVTTQNTGCKKDLFVRDYQKIFQQTYIDKLSSVKQRVLKVSRSFSWHKSSTNYIGQPYISKK